MPIFYKKLAEKWKVSTTNSIIKMLLFPSILSANFESLTDICDVINKSAADGFHLDVMDGVFVPNISFGFPVIEAIKKHATKPLDVHLMIVNPDPYIQRFKDAGADTLTVHIETCDDLRKTIDAIKNIGMNACIALNPETPIATLTNIIYDIHSVCIMSVHPGFGGQKFIEHTYSKIQQVKEIIDLSKSAALIKVDGGVDDRNSTKLIEVGANILVAGSSIFGTKDPLKAIQLLKTG